MIRMVHIVNQFFAGIGGEDKADIAVGVVEGAAGAARGLQAQLGDRGQVVATVYFGDNYFHEHKDDAIASRKWSSPVRRSTPVATVLLAWKSVRL